MDTGPSYATPAAFRRAITDRLKNKARAETRPVLQLRREFVMQQFLARVFTDPTSPWVLAGGTGLLVRIPAARYSRDIDLLHTALSLDLDTATDELRRITRIDAGDHLTFVIDDPLTRTGGRTLASLGVTAYIGATRFDRFSLDLATRPHPAAPVERRRPKPVIDLLSLANLPEFTLYPLPDQVADKVCAMYASYGVPSSPSTRYRDLVDLVLIITTCTIAAEPTVTALHSEAGRRGLILPQQMLPPGSHWPTGYAQTARETNLSRTLHDLDAALAAVGDCLTPLLGGAVVSGQWDPHQRRWTS